MKKIEEYVRSIPDFPEPGIIFRDVTSVIQDADGLQLAIDSMQDCLKDVDFDVITGLESRGFIFGMRSHTIFINHLFWSARRENFHVRQFPELTIWNTEVQRSRCTRIPSSQDRK